MLILIETTWVKIVDKKSWQSTFIKTVDNLHHTCYHQAGASDANASWYRLDDYKATSLLQSYWNCVISNDYDFSYRVGKLFSSFCPQPTSRKRRHRRMRSARKQNKSSGGNYG